MTKTENNNNLTKEKFVDESTKIKEVNPNRKKQKTKTKFDLENSSTWSNFWRIWIPTIVTQLIAGTFIVFDTMFIAHGYHAGHIGEIWTWNSDVAYAAIGPSGTAFAMPYTLLMVSTGLLIGGGISYKVIRQKANGDIEGAKHTMNNLTPIVLIYGFAMTGIFFIGSKFFIWLGSGFQTAFLDNWFNNPLFNSDWNSIDPITNDPNTDAIVGQLFQQAGWYLRIQALGSIPYIYMIASQITLRVEGKSNRGIRYTGASLAMNIVLDFLFIVVFGLNLVGAALATVLAQTLAASLYYRYYRKEFPIKMDSFSWVEGKKDIKEVTKLGTSTMFLQLISMLILLSFTVSIGIVYYDDVVASLNFTSAFQGYFSLFVLFILPVNGTAQATSVVVQYNYQQERPEKVHEARKIGFSITLIYSLIITVLILFYPNITVAFGRPSIGNFYPQRMAQIMFITFAFTSLTLLNSIYLQATGKEKGAMTILFIKSLIILPIALIIGFATKDADADGTNWSWASNEINSPYSVFLFYTIPIIDLITFPFVIIQFNNANKRVNELDNNNKTKNKIKNKKIN